jgi:hypothetical protein
MSLSLVIASVAGADLALNAGLVHMCARSGARKGASVSSVRPSRLFVGDAQR